MKKSKNNNIILAFSFKFYVFGFSLSNGFDNNFWPVSGRSAHCEMRATVHSPAAAAFSWRSPATTVQNQNKDV